MKRSEREANCTLGQPKSEELPKPSHDRGPANEKGGQGIPSSQLMAVPNKKDERQMTTRPSLSQSRTKCKERGTLRVVPEVRTLQLRSPLVKLKFRSHAEDSYPTRRRNRQHYWKPNNMAEDYAMDRLLPLWWKPSWNVKVFNNVTTLC